MNNWISGLFNMRRGQQIFNMFGRRRRNRNMMLGSLIGLGVSAAAYGMSRTQTAKTMHPVENLMNIIRPNNGTKMQNLVLSEFSKEILPNKNSTTNK